MSIRITCPSCGKRYAVKDALGGRQARCSCGASVPIPVPSQTARQQPSGGQLEDWARSRRQRLSGAPSEKAKEGGSRGLLMPLIVLCTVAGIVLLIAGLGVLYLYTFNPLPDPTVRTYLLPSGITGKAYLVGLFGIAWSRTRYLVLSLVLLVIGAALSVCNLWLPDVWPWGRKGHNAASDS
jgi:hypothetical protein